MSEIDTQDMFGKIRDFPRQIEEAMQIPVPETDFFAVENIIICGMGGSAIGAELVSAYLEPRLKKHIYINRNYNIPSWADSATLLILSSYSGNTAETLNCYQQGRAAKCRMAAITTGGKLQEFAENDNVPFILLPPGLPPRAALGYSFTSLLLYLSRNFALLSPEKDLLEAIAILNTNGKKWQNADDSSPPFVFACHCQNKIPVFYGSAGWAAVVVRRWANQFSENANVLAFFNEIPEMNHNEIMGWNRYPNIENMTAAFIIDNNEKNPDIRKRINISGEIIRKTGLDVGIVAGQGKSELAAMLSLINFGDWASYHLAILNETEPTKIDNILYLKEQLG